MFLKYVLLAYRDTPHVVIGFSPSDLLYAGKVQGPLKMLKDSWFQKEWPSINLCEWLTDAKAKLAEMALIVTDREAKAKAQMKTVYDRKAKEKILEPGELVLVKKPGQVGRSLPNYEEVVSFDLCCGYTW